MAKKIKVKKTPMETLYSLEFEDAGDIDSVAEEEGFEVQRTRGYGVKLIGTSEQFRFGGLHFSDEELDSLKEVKRTKPKSTKKVKK